MPYDCFISYASADLPLAENLHQRLLAEGFTVWFDKARLQPGFDWHREIEQGCENSRVFLPVLTPHWKNSDWTKYETYGAEAVIPLVFAGEWAEVCTPPLERFQAERLDCASAESQDWPRLYTSIRRLLAQPVPEKSVRISHLQHRANDYFVGREKELTRIHEELHCNPRVALTQGRVRAIAALGGVGKTTLVRHYAEKYWRCYPQMFWIDCRNGLEAEYANICDELFPQLGQAGLNPREKAARVLRELEGPATRLLILDNAEDERSTQEWIPKSGGCHTLITSRFANWSAAVQTFHLYVLDPEPAVRFLADRTRRALAGAEESAGRSLAEKMGYLPLALEQAAAYIEQQGELFGFSDYLHLYEESASDLLAEGALGSTFYPDSVITTWKPTVDKLTPGARTLLRVLSMMSATSVPVRMLIDGAPRVAQLTEQMEAAARPAAKAGEARMRAEIAQLRAYSMVVSDGQMLSMHPLLQTVEQVWLSPEEGRQVGQCAMDLFVAHAPIVTRRFEMTRRWRWLVAHAESLLAHARRLGIVPLPALLRGLSYVYYDQGQIKPALKLALESLAARRSLADLQDRPSLTCLQKVANMLNKVQHRGFAEAFLRRAAREMTARFGEKDPDTLSVMTDLANVLADRRKSEEAREIYRRTLGLQEDVLGPNHPETLISKIGLGSVHHDLREYDQAESILRQAVRGFEESATGAEDPDTAGAHAWLADTLKAQGKHAEAIPHYRRALDLRLVLLGPGHPETEGSANNLMVACLQLGQIEALFSIMRSFIEKGRTTLPADWGALLDVLEHNAQMALMTRRFSVAKILAQEILDIREKTVGHAHGSTLGVLAILVQWAQQAGDVSAAESFQRRLVASTENTQGPGHPDTLHALNGLARMLEGRGDWNGAEAEYRRALDRGREDMIVLGNYAFFRQNIRQDAAGARELYRRALEANPDDAINHANYASLCLITGEPAEAARHLHQAFVRAQSKPDGYLARTFYLRAALAEITGTDCAPYLGQFKTLLARNLKPAAFRSTSVRDFLRRTLPPDRRGLFDALYAALNEPDGLPQLSQRADWQTIVPVPLETPWPGTL